MASARFGTKKAAKDARKIANTFVPGVGAIRVGGIFTSSSKKASSKMFQAGKGSKAVGEKGGVSIRATRLERKPFRLMTKSERRGKRQ